MALRRLLQGSVLPRMTGRVVAPFSTKAGETVRATLFPGHGIGPEIAESVKQDNDAIIDRIQKSTRELKQGPIGKNLSSAEKRKFLINTLLGLEDSKEVVYNTLDAWVAFEQDFPLASIKQALLALEKEEQWHRIVQVIKWMLSKGQGNTIRTYEQLVCALEKDNRADEAHRIWEKKIAHDLHSVPWRFCHLMLAIYYRNNRLDRLVKLFKELEACGRKPPSKDIIRKVEDAYEMQGLLEEKKDLLDKYKDLYNKPSGNDKKKGREFKKADKNKKPVSPLVPVALSLPNDAEVLLTGKQRKMETSENVPVQSCPSDKEPDVTNAILMMQSESDKNLMQQILTFLMPSVQVCSENIPSASLVTRRGNCYCWVLGFILRQYTGIALNSTSCSLFYVMMPSTLSMYHNKFNYQICTFC